MHHLVGDLDRADLRDPADVVARKVDQHQVLGALLGIGEQFLLERERPPRGVAPRRRVPAIGRTVILRAGVRSWRTRISGEAPTTWKSPKS